MQNEMVFTSLCFNKNILINLFCCRLILNGLRQFLRFAVGSGKTEFADCWCYLLILIHVISGKCPLYGKPVKLNQSAINSQTCGLDCLVGSDVSDTFLE